VHAERSARFTVESFPSSSHGVTTVHNVFSEQRRYCLHEFSPPPSYVSTTERYVFLQRKRYCLYGYSPSPSTEICFHFLRVEHINLLPHFTRLCIHHIFVTNCRKLKNRGFGVHLTVQRSYSVHLVQQSECDVHARTHVYTLYFLPFYDKNTLDSLFLDP